jgi:hypothetical protein
VLSQERRGGGGGGGHRDASCGVAALDEEVVMRDRLARWVTGGWPGVSS